MSGFTINLPAHIQALAPGVSMVGPNTRVKGQPGFLGTQLDFLSFANGGTGSWAVPNVRTRISGAFMVSQSSQGLAALPNPPFSAAILAVNGDPRIRSL
jgi:hypothetical protein